MSKADDYPTTVEVGTQVCRTTHLLQPDRIYLWFAPGLDAKAADDVVRRAGLEPAELGGGFRISGQPRSVRGLAEELLRKNPGQITRALPLYVGKDGTPAAAVPIPGAIFVRFRPGEEARGHDQLTGALKVVRDERISERLAPYHMYRLEVGDEPSATFAAAEAAVALKSVEHAELDWGTLDAFTGHEWTPNDSFYVRGHQWHLGRIRMPEAWGLVDGPLGDPSVVVAIIDQGFWVDHPDLRGVFTPPETRHNVADESTDVSPPEPGQGRAPAHGTLLAGLIAAVTNNDKGVASVAGGEVGPDGVTRGCRILPIKIPIHGVHGFIASSDIAQAIDYVIMQKRSGLGIRVVNMSFECTMGDTIQAKLDQAWQAGLVLCASAGNYTERPGTVPGPGRRRPDVVGFPANYWNRSEGLKLVIAVGATNQQDWLKEPNDGAQEGSLGRNGSCYGQALDVVAPGMLLVTTDLAGELGIGRSRSEEGDFRRTHESLDGDGLTGLYTWLASNTSGACALVSGLAALICVRNPELTPREVRDIIATTCEKVHRYPESGERGGYTYVNRPFDWSPWMLWNEHVGYGRIDAYEALKAARPEPVRPDLTTAFGYRIYGSPQTGGIVVGPDGQFHKLPPGDPAPWDRVAAAAANIRKEIDELDALIRELEKSPGK